MKILPVKNDDFVATSWMLRRSPTPMGLLDAGPGGGNSPLLQGHGSGSMKNIHSSSSDGLYDMDRGAKQSRTNHEFCIENHEFCI